MRVWAGLILIVATVSGCVGSDPPAPDPPAQPDHGPGFMYEAVDALGLPVPVLLCHAGLEITAYASEVGGAGPWSDYEVLENATRCNLEMTPDQGREGNEVTIAVNPTDPRNIVGGAKDYYPADAGECVWDGVYVTHDGGRTPFADRSFDGSPWRLRQGDSANFVPNYASTFWCTTDPVAYFNTNGELYYLLMAYQTDPVTGSKLGEDELPNGALNDWAFNRATQIVAVSSDGGDSFHTFTPVLEGTFPINFHDKGWIAASADGTIHVMWLAVLAPGNMYCRSTDGGQTFVCDEVLATVGGGSGQGSFVEVGTGSEVYAVWYSGGIQMRRSLDTGDTWEPATMIHDTNPRSMPGLESRDRRTGYPAFATDRNPDSPFADAAYVVWNDRCGDDVWKPVEECETEGNNSIYFSASYDKGLTWSTGIRISDAEAVDAWSIFPAVSVSPGGVVDVSWMDTRGVRNIACHEGAPSCPQNYGDSYPALEQYYTYSLDGGKTWSRDFKVRDVEDMGWDPALCHHQNGMVFIGDYNDIDSSWQAAHPVWPDTRDGHCDVYTATIQRPMFADGWDSQKRAAAAEWIVAHPL